MFTDLFCLVITTALGSVSLSSGWFHWRNPGQAPEGWVRACDRVMRPDWPPNDHPHRQPLRKARICIAAGLVALAVAGGFFMSATLHLIG
jgi:hypothetical protein